MRRGARPGARRARAARPTPSSSASSAPSTGWCSPAGARAGPLVPHRRRAPSPGEVDRAAAAGGVPRRVRAAPRRARRRPRRGVQTNEVGRCAALAVGFTEVLRRSGCRCGSSSSGRRPGSTSAGTGGATSPARRRGATPTPPCASPTNYRAPDARRVGPARPRRRRASSGGAATASPIDPTTDEGRLLLRSFVWPDQADRHARLDAALGGGRRGARRRRRRPTPRRGSPTQLRRARARRGHRRVPLDRLAVPAGGDTEAGVAAATRRPPASGASAGRAGGVAADGAAATTRPKAAELRLTALAGRRARVLAPPATTATPSGPAPRLSRAEVSVGPTAGAAASARRSQNRARARPAR